MASTTFDTSILDLQRQWCQDNGVNFTPAFFVEGKEFPRAYERNELTFFIDDLIEDQEVDEQLAHIQTVS